MDSRKIRIYPPIIVSLVVSLVLSVAAFNTISSRADSEAEVSESSARGTPPEALAISTPATAGTITTSEAGPEPTQASMIGSRDWGAEDSEILLKIAMAEAEGESVEGKALVMLVVLNRVWSEDFPGTIEDVVFQPRQFSPVREGGRYYTTEPDRECYEALELVMQGWDESGGALYFDSCDKDSWHSENLEFLYQYGNHKFYR